MHRSNQFVGYFFILIVVVIESDGQDAAGAGVMHENAGNFRELIFVDVHIGHGAPVSLLFAGEQRESYRARRF